MNKIVVVGCGYVGLSYIFSLINSNLDIDELVLIDINKEKLEGNILDLNNACIACSRNINIKIGDYSDCTNAQLVCITAGKSQVNMKSRLHELEQNSHMMKSIIQQIKTSGFSGIYLIASNPLDIMAYTAWKNSGVDSSKIFGTGTYLETVRLKYYISQKLNVSIGDIEGYVLGEHGDTQFVAWSSVRVKGINIQEYLSIEELNEIALLVRNAGYYIANKTGASHYGISNCLREFTSIILNNETKIIPVCCYDPKLDLYISNLAKVSGKNGIEEIITLNLSDIEQHQYESSANFIKNIIT